MYETLKYLTQIQPPRNHKNIDSLNKVADYIKSRFEDIGLEVVFQEFNVDGKVYKNVIGTINPEYDKRLIMGGHYDVCGDIQGADDNASAVAGVVESARQLQQYKDDLNFRIDFVAFTLEEPPHFGTKNMGSYKHAEYLFDNDINVIGMINYEMIGYFTDEADSQNYPIEAMEDLYPGTGNFIAIVSNEDSTDFLNTLDCENIKKDIDAYNIVLPNAFDDMTASDHLNYWGFSFKAVMVTDTAYFRNENYHTVNDTIETIDFEKMRYTVDMVVNSIRNLDVGFDTSRRLDKLLKYMDEHLEVDYGYLPKSHMDNKDDSRVDEYIQEIKDDFKRIRENGDIKEEFIQESINILKGLENI